MKNLQEVFDRIQNLKKEQKEIKAAYADALKGSAVYQELMEQIRGLQEKKRQVELTIKAQFASEIDKLEELKEDLASDAQLLTDIAITKLTDGESLDIKDEYENEYEPVFNVKFKHRSLFRSYGVFYSSNVFYKLQAYLYFAKSPDHQLQPLFHFPYI